MTLVPPSKNGWGLYYWVQSCKRKILLGYLYCLAFIVVPMLQIQYRLSRIKEEQKSKEDDLLLSLELAPTPPLPPHQVIYYNNNSYLPSLSLLDFFSLYGRQVEAVPILAVRWGGGGRGGWIQFQRHLLVFKTNFIVYRWRRRLFASGWDILSQPRHFFLLWHHHMAGRF
jgi:hypothetical protein